MSTQSLRVGRDITADERRVAVLRAALTCIASQGYDNVRLRDVAHEAGVSIGALQHYFESRDDLVAQAFGQASEDLLDGWADALSGAQSPWERIVALVDHLVERDKLRERCLIWVDFATAAARHEETRRAFRKVYDRWEEIIREAIEEGAGDGSFRPTLPHATLVEVLLEQIDGAIMSIATGMDRVDGPGARRTTLALAGALLGRAG